MAKTSAPAPFGISALLFVLVWIVFGPAVHYPFVNFDDDVYVYENPVVRAGLTGQGIQWAFAHAHESNWHPLTTMSHMLDCQLFGLDAGKHHLINVLLHSVAVVLLFLVLRRLTSDTWPAAFVAALFAIHPLRAESVVWISERKDVLSGLFFMLTLWAYTRYVRLGSSLPRYMLVVAAFVLGLMSKPMLVTLPLVLLILDYWPLKRSQTNSKTAKLSWRRLLIEKVPLLAISLAVCIATVLAQTEARHSADRISVPMRLGNAVVSCAIYIGQLIWPVRLAAYYPYPVGGHSSFEIAVSVAVLAGLSAVAFSTRRKYPYLLAGWLWYLVMLLPVLGIVQVGAQARADRYTYLPEIGLGIGLAWAIKDWTAGWTARGPVLSAAAAIVIVALIPIARAQTATWRDSRTLWEHALACTTDNSVAEANLANELVHDGDYNGAIEHANRAVELDPEYADAQNCLGYALLQSGQLDAALTHLREAVKIKPSFASAHNNLGSALLQKAQLSEAIEQFQAATDDDPTMADAQNNLAAALVRAGNSSGAANHYETALKLAPDHLGARNNYAWLLASSTNATLRNGARAVTLASSANQSTDSKNLLVLRTLAAAYAENGQFREALESAGQALQIALAQQNATWIHALQAEMELYRAGRPFRADGSIP